MRLYTRRTVLPLGDYWVTKTMLPWGQFQGIASSGRDTRGRRGWSHPGKADPVPVTGDQLPPRQPHPQSLLDVVDSSSGQELVLPQQPGIPSFSPGALESAPTSSNVGLFVPGLVPCVNAQMGSPQESSDSETFGVIPENEIIAEKNPVSFRLNPSIP